VQSGVPSFGRAILRHLGRACHDTLVLADGCEAPPRPVGAWTRANQGLCRRRPGSLVVWAIREGCQCARAVDEWLMGRSDLPR